MAPYDYPDYSSTSRRRSDLPSPSYGAADRRYYFHNPSSPTAGQTSFDGYAREDPRSRPAALPNLSVNIPRPPLGPPPKATQSPYRRRKSWPPAPWCEDERLSLAREAGFEPSLLSWSESEAPSRGSIDQEPVIEDVSAFVDGRIVDSQKKTSSVPTKPNKTHRQHLGDQDESISQKDFVPEMAKRASSPYAYTKPEKTKNGDGYRDGSIPNGNLSSSYDKDGVKRSSHLAGFGLPRQSGKEDHLSSYPSEAVPRFRETSSEPRKSGTMRQDRRPDESHDKTHSQRPDLGGRRKTDLADVSLNAARGRSDPQHRNATPLMVSRTMSDFTSAHLFTASPDSLLPRDGIPHNHHRSRPASRGPSSGATSIRDDTSPHPSSRSHQGTSYDSRPGSAAHSKASSLSGSRSSSPFPRPLVNAVHALSLANEHQTRPPSSHNARPTSNLVRSATGGGGGANVLPYPDDERQTVPMPIEEDHQFPNDLPPANTPFSYERSSSWQSGFMPTNEPFSPSHQPYMSISRTSTSTLSNPDVHHPLDEHRHASVAGGETRKELSELVLHSASDCARSHPTRDYDDWYTIIGAPDVDICPDCVDSMFERTVFRPMIRRSLPKSAKARTQCALGASAWMRLAWSITLLQQRSDLKLLGAIAEIEMSNESCPGDRGAIRSWYGLRDPEGLYVRDFHICYTDVRKIECLLPALANMFVRLPTRSSPEQQICGMRCESNRFPTYVDALVQTHERAVSLQRGPDPMQFISLVERKTQLRECTKDNMLIGAPWYFIPKISAFTVCEDCFESMIEPEIRNRSEIATRFNKTAQPVHGEGMGSSCQLYSARMRRILRRAIDDDDLSYLSRKANERREAEVRLQERHKEVMRRLKRMSRDRSVNEDDERRMRRELERITDEWRTKWE